jgi:16S rRNA processing protein RimM
MADRIAIGAVRTTHGIRGYLKVRSFSGETEHFFKLDRITLKKGNSSRQFEVEAVKPNGDQLLMKLKGIDTPEEGKLYSNWEIWVPRGMESSLADNEYYHADLCGSRIVLGGADIGIVHSVIESGSSDLLEIRLKDDQMKLVPFNEVFIGSVDVEKKTIELLEGWILD